MNPSHPHGDSMVVLVVEDDPDHAALIQAAFAHRDVPGVVHVTGSSDEAVDYLVGRRPFDDRRRHPFPNVLILDLGRPGLGGLDFIRWLNSRKEPWAMTPVVVFTADTDRAVVAQAFALGARAMKVGPGDVTELVDMVDQVLKHGKPRIA